MDSPLSLRGVDCRASTSAKRDACPRPTAQDKATLQAERVERAREARLKREAEAAAEVAAAVLYAS